MLTINIGEKKIKETTIATDNNKALGLYGYGPYFFKVAQSIIREDIMKAIKHFFYIGHLLKKVNYTIFAFVPKVSNPYFYKDYRCIACCNTLYKCITKIMVIWLMERLQVANVLMKTYSFAKNLCTMMHT